MSHPSFEIREVGLGLRPLANSCWQRSPQRRSRVPSRRALDHAVAGRNAYHRGGNDPAWNRTQRYRAPHTTTSRSMWS